MTRLAPLEKYCQHKSLGARKYFLITFKEGIMAILKQAIQAKIDAANAEIATLQASVAGLQSALADAQSTFSDWVEQEANDIKTKAEALVNEVAKYL